MNPRKKEVSSKEYPAHWLVTIVEQILERNMEEINLATGKTPSGHIHLGILRELLICDALKRILDESGQKVNYRLFIDSLDAAKRFPPYISKDYAKTNLGRPFALIPNPFDNKDKSGSYARFFAEELANNFEELGIDVNIVWTDQLYQTKEMKNMIRIGLKKNEEVKTIVAKYLTASMTEEKRLDYIAQQKNWMGAMVICEKCGCTQKKNKDGTISPNRVLTYDEKTDFVSYICPACGNEGKLKISSGKVKLNWRLDWPAKWTMFQTVCEPAGKDHCTPGGSYDTGLELCKKIYGYDGPNKVAYEWLRLGDKDMGTSKGVVFTPSHFLTMAEPEIIRMQIYQTNPNKHISFRIEELGQYYNELEHIEKIYFNIEQPATPEEKREIDFIYPLILSNPENIKFQQRLPFKLLTVLAQLLPILGEEGIYKRAVEYMKKEKFETVLSKQVFLQKINRAKNWIEQIEGVIKETKDPKSLKELKHKTALFSIKEEMPVSVKKSLSQEQINALAVFLKKSEQKDQLSEEEIKALMMEIREENGIKPMKIFQAFYLILLGEKKGPRLGPLMAMLEKTWLEERIKKALAI